MKTCKRILWGFLLCQEARGPTLKCLLMEGIDELHISELSIS